MKVNILNNHIEAIIKLYKKQYSKYVQMLKISQEIESKIAEDVESLERMLLERDELIRQIDDIEHELAPDRESVMNILHLKEFDLTKVQGLIYDELLKELDQIRMSIIRIIKTITEIDQKIENYLTDKMKEVSLEIKVVRKHNQALRGYLDRPDFAGPRFFDKKR